nr:MAG TPA: hypothetical protein [Caudoviricetes sp.]
MMKIYKQGKRKTAMERKNEKAGAVNVKLPFTELFTCFRLPLKYIISVT